MVVPFNAGVVYVVPVAIELPPLTTSYQLIVPALAVAARTTVPASQREAGVVDVMVGVVFTVANTAVRDELQPVAVAST